MSVFYCLIALVPALPPRFPALAVVSRIPADRLSCEISVIFLWFSPSFNEDNRSDVTGMRLE